MMHPSPNRRCRMGMTLLEVVLAMGLLTVLSSLTYWFYASSLDSRRKGMEEAQRLRLARVVLDRIVTEIRQSAMVASEKSVAIQGQAEQIRITTLRTPDRTQYRDQSESGKYRRVASDIVRVAYHIVRHPDIKHEDGYELPLGLGRMESRVPRPDYLAFGDSFGEGRNSPLPKNESETSPGETGQTDPESAAEDQASEALVDAILGEGDKSAGVGAAAEINWEELYAPEIKYLRFCYFDGSKWWDTWNVQGENPLPQMVQVTIGFEGQAPFGKEFGSKENEEFCTCLNQDPVDCERLPDSRLTRDVRLVQADPLFRSRVTREGQAFMDKMLGEEAAP